GREVQETCNTRDGVRTCTRTERDLRPGEPLQAPAPDAAPAPPAAPLQHSGLIKADFQLPAAVAHGTFAGPPPGLPGAFNVRVLPPPGPGGVAAELALT